MIVEDRMNEAVGGGSGRMSGCKGMLGSNVGQALVVLRRSRMREGEGRRALETDPSTPDLRQSS
jgi:hypothetical protein